MTDTPKKLGLGGACACWRHTSSSETQLVYYIQRNEEGVGFVTLIAEGGGRLANLGRRSLEGGQSQAAVTQEEEAVID